ncbi:hypothetical protein BDY19DRAFT_4063 [Irpex rosettiformis]|uniref:Uncharacterized protein n=1 Tax=Irpex rosettiformis TaxID=378272 RepID=A0ACB8UIZ5_9APHY|nr:hypothetical protein BDY19DRAFT_4063 [Irpex rosettiformis]
MREIQHPYVITLENAIVQGDSVYIAMELAPYGTLGDLIRRYKGGSMKQIHRLLRISCVVPFFSCTT